MKLRNGSPLPRFEPMIPGELAIVLIDLAIPVFPGVELAGGELQPGKNGLGRCFGVVGPVTDVVHHHGRVCHGEPNVRAEFPKLFFDLTFSSSSSAITSFLVASLASSC